MISSYKKLTGRYLKANKKRTILTLIGIILSVALISSIGLFIKGVQAAEVERAIKTYGAFHLAYENVDEELLSKVINNPKVARYGLYSQGELIEIEKDYNAQEISATGKALELLPYRIKEGKMPDNEGEVALEKWALDYLYKGKKIGDKLQFNDKEYKLTGILENSLSNQYDNLIVYLTKNESISKDNSVLLVEISSKTNMKKALSDLKALSKAENISENSSLLSRLGVYDDGSAIEGVLKILIIIISIVVVATVAVIYNSFQISVVERIKEFGLLRAVGTTPRQIRSIVLREATILACIGIPIGLMFGIVAIWGITVAFKLIGGEDLILTKFVVDPLVMVISAMVGLISIYLSALLPSIFAGRISPLAAISSRTAITKEKIRRRKHRLAQKIFGYEGALAAKNIKRNKKRYRITVFSIVISVVLFVTFKSFMDMAFNVTGTANASRDIHFSIYRDYDKQDIEIDEDLINSIKKLSYVDKVYKKYMLYNFDVAISKESKIKELEDVDYLYKSLTVNGEEKTLLMADMDIYDSTALEEAKKYVEAGSIDMEKLDSGEGVIVIKKNNVYNNKTKKVYVGPVANLKVGDEIEVQAIYDENIGKEFGEGKVKKVKVLAILSDDPLDFYGFSGLKLIGTENGAKNILEEDKINSRALDIKLKDVKDEETAKEKFEDLISSNPDLKLINEIDQNRNEKSSMLMIEILIYGFVIVIALISCVNIINTLTTNILLRKREFASLKSIGLSQKGLRKMIVLEGLLYGIVGSIYGSIAGTGLSYLMYNAFDGIREFKWPVPWNAILIATVAALVIGYIAVLSPLSRIKKENLIEAIREE
ncbi:MAG: FtsX-like permease family protein [Clostridiales bacterium]|uniref:ABC transporter permease n=1 Tax=Clostridium sp. N3C TaxID=1776758 RepID=UPI00092E0CA3|nr:FtsX-like permease family protein [Clostridium sp. N3C]NLZ49526.1 FtsX-like permease family protein [Clostridiales bacterium]SCN22766.1 ABC transporter permease YtrF precursor [Clostridium sp. N3C]